MAEQLKNTLSFNLDTGASVVLPHGLQTALGTPLAPDIIFVPSTELVVDNSDDVAVTLRNDGGPITGALLVESWHTIERAFGGAQFPDLPVKPYIVFGGESPVEPPFDVGVVRIYARTTGDDLTGNGTLAKPYRTFQRAVRDVPPILGPGTSYVIDITGPADGSLFDETLPDGYTLPAWKSPNNDDSTATTPFQQFGQAITIFATPQRVQSLTPAEATINVGDVTITNDPITTLSTFTLTGPARPGWAGIKGKFVLDSVGGIHNVVISEASPTAISVTGSNAVGGGFHFPLQIIEPSAWLHGNGNDDFGAVGSINAHNVDDLGFCGIKITSDNGFPGLFFDGNGCCGLEFCELEDPQILGSAGNIQFDNANRVANCWVKAPAGLASFTGQSLALFKSLFDGVATHNGPFLPAATAIAMLFDVFDGCGVLETIGYNPTFGPAPAGTLHWSIQRTAIKNGTSDGVRFHGTYGRFAKVDISNNVGNGIVVNRGGGLLYLEHVGSTTPNLGAFGVDISDGMQVQADVDTVVTLASLSGATDDVSVGSVGAKSWAQVAAAVNIPDYAGANATGARIFQANF